jgi:hypothetical protein
MFGELPASALYVRHAGNINIKNMKISYTGKDFRTPFIFDDVDSLSVNNMNVHGFDSLPLIILNKVKVKSLQDVQIHDKRLQLIKVQ